MSSLQKFNWEAVLVEEFIRKGSFCYVTKATLFSHKKAHGRPVAIKYITEDICLANNVDFDRTVNLLREEAEKISLAKRNNARNVVSIYGTVEGILPQETAKVLPSAKENQRAFGILLKYEGISLHEYLHQKENKHISLVKKLEILRDLCCAIMDLHDLDLVDGDIKPSNVVVSGNDPVRVRVIDFGVSNYVEGRSEEIFAHSALTITDHYVGSLPYCAPGKSSRYCSIPFPLTLRSAPPRRDYRVPRSSHSSF
jgi:serine/threonine protein kinase